jgi:Ran GTPase-activating protein (RanGAP) involved in mRNA processing and transport
MDGADLLAEAPFEALTSLSLGSCQLRAGGARALAQAEFWPRLQHLSLSNNDLRPRDLRRLLDAAGPLLTLKLSHNPLGEEGARALLAYPHLDQVQRLSLDACELGEDAAESLLKSGRLGALRELSLADNALRNRLAHALAHAPLVHLRRLDLSDNELGERAALDLAASPLLASLSALNLAKNCINERGQQALMASPLRPPDLQPDLRDNRPLRL